MAFAATAAIQLNIHADSERAGVAEELAEPAQLESDQLLVAALNAVARLRDTVDRIVVFSQLRDMLEHERRALEQNVANEQSELEQVIRERQALVTEMRGRVKHLVHVLEIDIRPNVERVLGSTTLHGTSG
jgi:hypothetical protein